MTSSSQEKWHYWKLGCYRIEVMGLLEISLLTSRLCIPIIVHPILTMLFLGMQVLSMC